MFSPDLNAGLELTETCLHLAKHLVLCRAQGQRKLLMRGQRSKSTERLSEAIAQMKAMFNS